MRKNQFIDTTKNDISILTLDDDEMMTVTVQAYFRNSGYSVDTENDPYRAIERIRDGSYDILLLDFLMTPICGDKVVSEIRQFNRDIFIVLLTGHKSIAPPVKTIRELDIQGYYEKSDRFDQLELLVESCVKSIRQMRTIRGYRDELASKNEMLTVLNEQLKKNYTDVVNTIRSVVDARDIYTRGHSDRVAYLSARIFRELGGGEEDCERIRIAGLLHDIGKIRIPDGILLKEGCLTNEEMSIMRQHPKYSVDILKNVSFMKDIMPIVLSHHERYDGTGYPNGVSGEEIPYESRIICVADSFDAMTSFRRYRANMTPEQAMEQIRVCSGTQFDPSIANVALRVLAEYDKFGEDPLWSYPSAYIN